MTEEPRPRILIVEDTRPTAVKYQRALSRIGECRIVEQEQQVLPSIAEFDPQVVLLDIVLEGRQEDDPWDAGLRILQTLHQHHPALPVVVVTGRLEDQIEADCRELGVAAFARKPVGLAELRGAVQAALAGHGQAEGAG